MVLVTEEPLTGGNNALEVARASDTVRRTRDGGAADPDTKNAQPSFVVTPTGSDGYRATVAWAELDPAFSGKKALPAVTQDGKKQGPRLVVPGGVKGGRYVSGVVRLYVGDSDALDRS